MVKADLDDMDRTARMDPSGMLDAVDHFPDPLLNASNAPLANIKLQRRDFRNLVLMGMGGSASAGDVTLDWLRDQLKVPAIVHRESSLPGFVDSSTLFVAISYSGNTSETLSGFAAAKRRGCATIGIGTGGKLADLCLKFRVPFIRVEPALAPRAALSQLIVGTSIALSDLATPPTIRELNEAGRDLARIRIRLRREAPSERNQAKRFASKLLGHFVVVYSLQGMSSVGRRFKNQLAENSKVMAKYDSLPESSHNEVVAWNAGSPKVLPVVIRDNSSTFDNSVVRAFSETIGEDSGLKPLEVRFPSRRRLSRLLLPIFFLDYVSVYLAILRGVDPTPTNQIGQYKKKLESLLK